jgi:acetyl-CoA synthase
MSKIIASAAIRGAHKIVERTEKKWQEAMEKWGAKEPVGFPNTAYYLPVIYGILGNKVEKLGDMEPVLKRCKSLLPPPVREEHPLPYLAPALDAGMATLFAEELIEAIRYLETPDFYTKTEDPVDGNIWLGAADDVILRKRGVEFVDGTAPGFAAIVGAAPTNKIAANIAQELQQKNLYVFMASEYNGKKFSEQLVEEGVQIGWPTRLVSFGPDISAAVFAMGFATRAAMSFGGIEPGNYRKILIYNKDRIFAFVLPMGYVNDEWYANAAGAINWGFPVIADTPIPEVLPTGICTYEHVVSNIPHDQLVAKAVEVRGLKVAVAEVPVPVAYGPAFEGERVRGEDIYLECGGGRTPMVEWVTTKRMEEVEDGKVEVIGPELSDIEPGSRLPFAIAVEVAGREMQDDFEPILERQIHHLINYAQGVMHIGQRDIAWIRIAKQAVEKGFKLHHIGDILHAKLHQDFGRIFDKIQVKLYTEEDKVKEVEEKARAVYKKRDVRIEGMTDETTDTYYSCTLCQSFAPSHVCVISPERTGLCGSYNWMDCKASYEINPTGPNQPVEKGEVIDQKMGQWKGVNDFVLKASRGKIDHYNFYSIVNDPMTTCGCCECIAAVLPMCNGIMTVNREYTGETPCGMKFTTLAGTIGGGLSTPGFVGHGKYNTCQR